MGNRIAIAAGAAGIAASLIAAPASQASVTIGSDLAPSPPVALETCACTILQTALPGAQLTSPVNGTVVRWRVVTSNPPALAGIRIVRPVGNSRLFLGGATIADVPAGTAIVRASLPISVGDRVALDMSATVAGNLTTPGSTLDLWVPQTAAGQAPPPTAVRDPEELYYNAEIEPTNTFTVGTPVLDKKKGNATVDVGLPNTGTVQAAASRVKLARVAKSQKGKRKRKRPKSKPLITPFTVTSIGPGTATLRLNSSKPVQRALRAKGKAKGLVTITYTPDFGSPSIQTLTVSLKLKSKSS